MHEHDRSYRLLFAQPRMVEDLVREFVPEAWVERLDFSTLERVNASYVFRRMKRREGDMVWKLRRRMGPRSMSMSSSNSNPPSTASWLFG